MLRGKRVGVEKTVVKCNRRQLRVLFAAGMLVVRQTGVTSCQGLLATGIEDPWRGLQGATSG
jgi:hypothetical protein